MEKRPADLLIKNASQLLTLAGPSRPRKGQEMEDIGVVTNGAVAINQGEIVSVGTTERVTEEINLLPYAEVVDAYGKVVMPGIIDPHTHVVFGGTREEEFEQRLQGADYLEILEKGGGILSTVRETREASEQELIHKAKRNIKYFLNCGVTTLEVKSGYGLDLETELKQLRVAKKLPQLMPVDVVLTFLGAHAFPPEYKDRREEYVDLVVNQMLPAVAEEGLAEFCDVFCEEKIFTIEQSRRVLEAGKSYGLKPKLHADEIVPYGGAELAAEVQAVSADHLLQISSTGIEKMAKEQVIGVMLPGTAFFLMKNQYAPAREMIEAGVPLALSTDRNPGSSPTEAVNLVLSLACLQMRMTPAEAITAATLNAAYAVERGTYLGSLEEGKQGDVLLLDAPNYKYIPYHYGVSLVDKVYKKGTRVVI